MGLALGISASGVMCEPCSLYSLLVTLCNLSPSGLRPRSEARGGFGQFQPFYQGTLPICICSVLKDFLVKGAPFVCDSSIE